MPASATSCSPSTCSGRAKLHRLVALARRVRLSVTLDNAVVAERAGAAMREAGLVLPVLIECDTGGERCGVQTPDEALELARLVDGLERPAPRGPDDLPGPRPDRRHRAPGSAKPWPACRPPASSPPWSAPAARPTSSARTRSPVATEHRPGTYIYTTATRRAPAAASRTAPCASSPRWSPGPTDGRAILDAGSKTLSSDTLGLEGFGLIVEYPQLVLAKFSEEHGHVDCSASNARPASASASPSSPTTPAP